MSPGISVAGLVYEDTPRYDTWFRVLLGAIQAVFFLAGVLLLSEDIGGALLMFGTAVFYALLLSAITPRRFQVFEDRLRIVLGGPFAFDMRFSNIKQVRPVWKYSLCLLGPTIRNLHSRRGGDSLPARIKCGHIARTY